MPWMLSLHLLTIAVGLLIALGLEGCVAHWKQRELEKDADTKLRQEIRDNAKEIASVLTQVQAEFPIGHLAQVTRNGAPL
jgi:hypothetical protein